MRTLLRRSLVLCLILLLLLPTIVLAQTGTDRIVNLIFSEDDSSVHVKETVQSTARVSFTHAGKDYTVKAPVTIAVDTNIPLTASVSAADSTLGVGAFAVEVIRVVESEVFERLDPSSEDNKIIAVVFRLTNTSDETREVLDDWDDFEKIFGVDDLGRRFEMEQVLGCEGEQINPGSARDCLVAFDVEKTVTLVRLEFYLMDKGSISLPEAEEYEGEGS